MAGIIKRAIRFFGTPFFRLRRAVAPQIDEIDVLLPHLPQEFVGYRIAVVSDLHLPDNLCTIQQILDGLRGVAPDCILLAGDLTNRYNRFDGEQLTAFLQAVGDIAPAFAISGNHEQNEEREQAFFALFKNCNVTPLENCTVLLEKDGGKLPLCGVSDPDADVGLPTSPAVLLIHNPKDALVYADRHDLAVCGHAHGGQVRLGTRGLFAPGQGFFAKYISGLYHVGNMQMVVSRGLGDSSLPIRLRNSPHLPVIILQ